MTVIAKYVVVRDGVELDEVFTDKKAAEAYDKMLDAAQGLAELIKQGPLNIEVDAKTVDEISIHLAKNAPEVTTILKAVKPIKPTAGSPPSANADGGRDKAPVQNKAKSKTKAA